MNSNNLSVRSNLIIFASTYGRSRNLLVISFRVCTWIVKSISSIFHLPESIKTITSNRLKPLDQVRGRYNIGIPRSAMNERSVVSLHRNSLSALFPPPSSNTKSHTTGQSRTQHPNFLATPTFHPLPLSLSSTHSA